MTLINKIIIISFCTISSFVSATSIPSGSEYARENKYTVVYFRAPNTLNKDQERRQLRIFEHVAHDKRYASSGLKFKSLNLQGERLLRAQKELGFKKPQMTMIFREGVPYRDARLDGFFTEEGLTSFIEQWIGDYTNALLDARREAKRAATAVSYASYPMFYGYPYYGMYGGWGYPYGYGGVGMGIWF